MLIFLMMMKMMMMMETQNIKCSVTADTDASKEDIDEEVDHPVHYKLNENGIECIDAIEATMDFYSFQEYCRGTVMKYLWRCNYKNNKLKDLKKASWYLNKIISNIEKNGDGI